MKPPDARIKNVVKNCDKRTALKLLVQKLLGCFNLYSRETSPSKTYLSAWGSSTYLRNITVKHMYNHKHHLLVCRYKLILQVRETVSFTENGRLISVVGLLELYLLLWSLFTDSSVTVRKIDAFSR